MTFEEFRKELNGKRVEGELITTVFLSLVVSITFLAIVYFIKLKDIPNFLPKYGLYIFLSVIGYVIILPAFRQVRAYQQMPCMSGMMIGMTIGMIAGFLPGFYVGSTNGMFVGSVFGMTVGIFLGIWAGKCCGIMGIMEGIMAGFMGGLMGAMTAVMMLNDHLKAMAVISLLIGSSIVIGLNYMIYNETKSEERHIKEDHTFTVILTLILIAATTFIIVFGPRSALFS